MNELPKGNERSYIVRTPDHSEDNALFLGEIPRGEYGAGKLSKADGGTCVIEKYSNASITVVFHGNKLQGKYHFLNMAILSRNRNQKRKNVYAFFKAKSVNNENHTPILTESSIDFPDMTLSEEIWDIKNKEHPTLKPENKKKILNLISKYPKFNLRSIIKNIHIIGSICTNQYVSTTDIDTHMIVDEDELDIIIASSNEFKTRDDVTKDLMYYSKHADPPTNMIEQHPIEFYIQFNIKQDLASDGCYDVLSDKWLSGPKIIKYSFNPYEYYKHLLEEVRGISKKFDLGIGELKRDVIDYDVIHDALLRIPEEEKKKIHISLSKKVVEIEDDIKDLMLLKKDIIDMRHGAKRLKNDDKEWSDINAKFKFLDRYHYLKIIKDLECMMKDNRLDDKEIPKIKNILKKY